MCGHTVPLSSVTGGGYYMSPTSSYLKSTEIMKYLVGLDTNVVPLSAARYVVSSVPFQQAHKNARKTSKIARPLKIINISSRATSVPL